MRRVQEGIINMREISQRERQQEHQISIVGKVEYEDADGSGRHGDGS